MAFAISEGFEQWLVRYEEMLFCVVMWSKWKKVLYRVKEMLDRHKTWRGDRAHETMPVAQKDVI